MEYNVRLEFSLPPTEAAAEQLLEALAEFHPAPGSTATGTLDVWITVQASGARQAVALGLALAAQATPAELLGLEAITAAEFDRRQRETHVPELVGVADAAEILGVSRQAVDKMLEPGGRLVGHRVGGKGTAIAKADVYAEKARRERVALGIALAAAADG
jgi:hypothetical protein